MGGRWAHGGGPADRRVLDALRFLALQAVQDTIEADIRRLALHTGLGRETVRVALQRLAVDGWIAKVADAHGTHGARWKIDPQDIFHSSKDSTRSQAITRRAAAAPAHREMLLHQLHTKLSRLAHDVFPHGHTAGIHAGNLYAKLIETTPLPSTTISQRTGLTGNEIESTMRGLASHGLVRGTACGWLSTRLESCDTRARQLGVNGRLEGRERRYTTERQLWAWWQAEEAWMRSSGKTFRREAPTQGIFAFDDEGLRKIRYPRHGRRGDHRTARKLVSARLLAA